MSALFHWHDLHLSQPGRQTSKGPRALGPWRFRRRPARRVDPGHWAGHLALTPVCLSA